MGLPLGQGPHCLPLVHPAPCQGLWGRAVSGHAGSSGGSPLGMIMFCPQDAPVCTAPPRAGSGGLEDHLQDPRWALGSLNKQGELV